MISLKVLSTAAALALVLPVVASDASFAQGWHGGRGAGFNGGGFRAGGGGAHIGGGFRGAAVAANPRIGGAMAAAPRFAGTGSVAVGPRYTGGNWNGGYRGGGWNGGYYRRGYYGGGFIPGAVAGAVIGGALASQSYAYYDSPGYYYGSSYYDDGYGYYDEGAVAAEAAPAGDASYCAQRYRSYDPASGTYLGYDGQRYPCP